MATHPTEQPTQHMTQMAFTDKLAFPTAHRRHILDTGNKHLTHLVLEDSLRMHRLVWVWAHQKGLGRHRYILCVNTAHTAQQACTVSRKTRTECVTNFIRPLKIIFQYLHPEIGILRIRLKTLLSERCGSNSPSCTCKSGLNRTQQLGSLDTFMFSAHFQVSGSGRHAATQKAILWVISQVCS